MPRWLSIAASSDGEATLPALPGRSRWWRWQRTAARALADDDARADAVELKDRQGVTLFREIDARLQGAEGRVVQVLAPRRGMGASTVARRLARTAAVQCAAPVLLVDANPAAPAQEKRLGVHCTMTLSEGGGTDADLTAMLQNVPGSLLWLAVLARRERRLAMARPRMEEVLARLRRRFQWIVFDCGPPGQTPESELLLRLADGTAVVVEAGRARIPVARQLVDHLHNNGGHPLGVVLNKRRLYIPNFLYRWL